ncbi:formimidoyltransferase-cyclodeaminase isoform X2 [Lepidochelys kempii]|uniref:formimidoyltransferase-cyclodeaminase isoform X2 n=1 Tax=Lepidochelys kempii TaxID=8472 RepID=UPI003C6EDE8B
MKAWLMDRSHRVVVNGESPSNGAVPSRVPSGSALGLMLLTMSITELEVDLKSLLIKLADYTRIGGVVTSEDNTVTPPDLDHLLTKAEWVPDFGSASFVPRWGATVTGARTFLVAYNINLLCTKELAHRIALNIREQGRAKDQPGRLKKVQGMGWYLDEENIAQVSTNLLDFEITSLHTVYEEVCKDARELSLPVVGSQLVGLVPKKAMLDAAEYYIQKENLFILEEEQKIRLVVSRLGLDSLSPFNPQERIIEYLVQSGQADGGLVSKSLHTFVRAVGARSAAPGGGSVSAAMSALGAALGCMVGLMSYGKRQFEALELVMRKLIPPFHQAMNELIVMVDTDSLAFSSYMDAMKLPKNTPEEREKRTAAMQQGLKKAVGVPFSLAEKVNALWPMLKEMAQYGNLACKSDLQVAAKALEAGVFGAYFNVVTNLKDITDEAFRKETHGRVSSFLAEAQQSAALILELLEGRGQ